MFLTLVNCCIAVNACMQPAFDSASLESGDHSSGRDSPSEQGAPSMRVHAAGGQSEGAAVDVRAVESTHWQSLPRFLRGFLARGRAGMANCTAGADRERKAMQRDVILGEFHFQLHIRETEITRRSCYPPGSAILLR